jgi:hypothetical protein
MNYIISPVPLRAIWRAIAKLPLYARDEDNSRSEFLKTSVPIVPLIVTLSFDDIHEERVSADNFMVSRTARPIGQPPHRDIDCHCLSRRSKEGGVREDLNPRHLDNITAPHMTNTSHSQALLGARK